MTEDLLPRIAEWLKAGEWEPELQKDGRTYGMVFEGKNATFNVYVRVSEGGDAVAAYSGSPVPIPQNLIDQAAVFVSLVNYRLLVGCLQLDPSTGAVWFSNFL